MSVDIHNVWAEEVRLRLNDSNRVNEVLEEIKNHFSSIPGSEISQKVQILGLVSLLNRLFVRDAVQQDPHIPSSTQERKVQQGKEIDCLCEILETCLPTLPLGYALRESRDVLLEALTHPNSNIREIIIRELHRTCMNEKSLHGIESSFVNTLAIAVVRSIGDDEIKVAAKAKSILSHNEEWLQRPGVLEEFRIIMDGKASNRCKCYEVIINISKKSPQNLDSCSKSDLIQRVTNDLQTDDLLLQLNVLEILADLAEASHGLQYLVDNGVLRFVADMVNKVEVDGLSNLMTPGLMKFFGNIAHWFPSKVLNDLQESYPNVVESLFKTLKSHDLTLGPVALDTLGHIGSTIEGKLALATLGQLFTSSVPDIGDYIRNSPTDARIRALQCASNLICVNKNIGPEPIPTHVDQRVTLMTREWFRSLSESPSSIDLLFAICKNPFPDLKLAALGLLSSVVEHNWGKEMVRETPGLIEFLLDRSVENDKEAKHAKFEIISILSMSSMFDVHVILRLKNYVEEGPFYVQGLTEVAIEGD